ncbi:BMP family lipoprotein [Phosphitispora fastidiosa]|uniref:BMP family lipoprotein n=1 Tax=Phosphitispora fastidiosa TaxID=2837202 RepID=UPI001E637F79|nr:BMP family ABC transporter substrate-binding protein [Phosphitispora fastidiosa]MBU7005553.1 basic membrane protein A [Phosphitispora fastidiosa]
MAFRRVVIFGLLVVVISIIGGCSGKAASDKQEYKQYGSRGPESIGVILGSAEKTGGLLNAAAASSVKGLAGEQGLEYTILSPGDLVNNAETIRFLAENGHDLIIAVGPELQEDLSRLAPEYPDTAFAIIEGEVDQPNVLSIKIGDDEGVFLAGVAAASLTKTNLVGYIGGELTDTRQEKAFAQGVQYINLAEGKQVKVVAVYAGVTKEAAAEPERGKELGNKLYDAGSDVVFTAAGSLGKGLAGAAAERRKIALANDRQLLETMSSNVYSAVVQKPEKAVYTAAAGILKNGVSGGRAAYGLKEGSVDFVLSQEVSPELTNKIIAVREQVKNDQIKLYTVQIPEGLVTKLSHLPVDLKRTSGTAQPGVRETRQGTGSSGAAGSTAPNAGSPTGNGSAGEGQPGD